MITTVEHWLEELKQKIMNIENLDKKYLDSKGTKNGFEDLVESILETNPIFKKLEEGSDSSYLGAMYKLNFGHFFPDIDVYIAGKKFGVELKSRTDGSLKNNGGSVFESVSDLSYDEIYLFFGTYDKKKNETKYRITYDFYWKCVEAIKVTHSPRYYLNMETKECLFDSSAEYKTSRSQSEKEKITWVQNKLKESARKETWYVSDGAINKISPTKWNELDDATQTRYEAEIALFFPHYLLSNKSTKFDVVLDFLVTEHYCIKSNIKDTFTGSGTVIIKNVDNIPRIIANYQKLVPVIKQILNEQSEDFKKKLYDSWSDYPDADVFLEYDNLFNDFCEMLNYMGDRTPNIRKCLLKLGARLSEIIINESGEYGYSEK